MGGGGGGRGEEGAVGVGFGLCKMNPVFYFTFLYSLCTADAVSETRGAHFKAKNKYVQYFYSN